MRDEPTISICMITYNHAKYIAQAIEGVLMQEVDCRYELVISDDCSTDQTQEICERYQAEHPSVIRYIRREQNLGMNANFIATLQACQGEYIALCEGDDYWIASSKLKTQLDFMRQNLTCSICFHRAQLLYEQQVSNTYPDINVSTPAITSIVDLARGNYIHTPTCMFRNHHLEFPVWMHHAFPPDWVLHLLNAQYGKICFLDYEFAVYRIHPKGVLSTHRESKYGDSILNTLLQLQSFFSNQVHIQTIFRKSYEKSLVYFRGVENIYSDSRWLRSKLMFNYALEHKKLTFFFLSLIVLLVPSQILTCYQGVSRALQFFER